MTSYRWTKHRVVDAMGNESVGDAPISLWWLARAAAEETLQGSPMVTAWLTLFRAHLSSSELRELRWRNDLAESAELRRSYSGLYGRFMARALLTHHLGLSRFVSLKRDGITLPGSIAVTRQADGDTPDWLAWDDANSRFVLCEAKGSLTATDFLAGAPPRCVGQGKGQFRRVTSTIAGKGAHPAEWVAASRWSTDRRGCMPITLLWDPPTEDTPFEPVEADGHRQAITRAWLDSIAPGFGLVDANDILAATKQNRAVIVRAEPGPIPEARDWPRDEDTKGDEANSSPQAEASQSDRPIPEGRRVVEHFAPPPEPVSAPELDLVSEPRTSSRPTTELAASTIYAGREVLAPRAQEKAPFEGGLIAALVTSLGIRPIRTKSDLAAMHEAQERARGLKEPAMLIGIPLEIDPERRAEGNGWLDGAGIAMPNDLAVFDLREVNIDPAGALPG